jgi:hypothetical protein
MSIEHPTTIDNNIVMKAEGRRAAAGAVELVKDLFCGSRMNGIESIKSCEIDREKVKNDHHENDEDVFICITFGTMNEFNESITSRQQRHQRFLLESPLCTLDRIDVATTTTLSLEEAVDQVYWLRYDKGNDRLSVSKQVPQVFDHDNVELLRLTLHLSNATSLDFDTTIANPASSSTPNYRVGTKLLWEDCRVNIWEFRIAPQEQCPYHSYGLEYCYTNLTESVTQALTETGVAAPNDPPRRQVVGQTVFVEQESLGSHAVKNVGSSTFLQFIVEFKYKI